MKLPIAESTFKHKPSYQGRRETAALCHGVLCCERTCLFYQSEKSIWLKAFFPVLHVLFLPL